MKLYEILEKEKEGRYKIRSQFHDNQGGFCVGGLIAEGMEKGYCTKPDRSAIGLYVHKHPSFFNDIITFDDATPLMGMTAQEVKDKSKLQVMKLLKAGIVQLDNKVAFRDLAIANDYSEMDFDDFISVFKECNV